MKWMLEYHVPSNKIIFYSSPLAHDWKRQILGKLCILRKWVVKSEGNSKNLLIYLLCVSCSSNCLCNIVYLILIINSWCSYKHRKEKWCTVKFRISSKVPLLIMEELRSSADILIPAGSLLTMRKKSSSAKHSFLSTLTWLYYILRRLLPRQTTWLFTFGVSPRSHELFSR